MCEPILLECAQSVAFASDRFSQSFNIRGYAAFYKTHRLQTPSKRMMGRLSVKNGADADDDAAVLLVQLKVFLVFDFRRFVAN